MTAQTTKDVLIARLIKAGELFVAGAPADEIASYFDVETYRFYAPDGVEADFAGLSAYFDSLRDAFDDRSIRRGIIVVDGKVLACQTWIEGTFAPGIYEVTGGFAAAQWRPGDVRADEHLQVRRPGADRRRDHSDG